MALRTFESLYVVAMPPVGGEAANESTRWAVAVSEQEMDGPWRRLFGWADDRPRPLRGPSAQYFRKPLS